MALDLNALMAAVADVQREIAPPEDAKPLASITDEPPVTIAVFPTFVNLEERADIEQPQGSGQQLANPLEVGMHLLFSGADGKYSTRERRRWLAAILETFRDAKHRTLGGAALGHFVTGFDTEPFDWNGAEYPALNVELRVVMQG